MKRIYYNKLIRDRILKRITESGGDYKVRKLSKKEFEIELLKKILEETNELLSAKTNKEFALELADVVAIIEEITKLKKITKKKLMKAMKENFARKGGFKKKLFLIWSSDTGYKTNERRYTKKQ